MSKLKYNDYLRRISPGVEPVNPVRPDTTLIKSRGNIAIDVDGNPVYAPAPIKPAGVALDDYRDAVDPVNPVDTGDGLQITGKLNSGRDAVNSYLQRYTGKDYSGVNISDSSILNDLAAQGLINYDQFAEGQIVFNQYLSNLAAERDKNAALAAAENNARKQTAQVDYNNKKLLDYLAEVQGNAGLEGYGLAKGQAIDLSNRELNAMQGVEGERIAARENALQAYQNALRENSAAYTDQYGTLLASRESKEDTNYQNYLVEVQNMVPNLLDEEGKISEDNYNKLYGYVDGLDISSKAKQNIKNYIDTAYGSYVKNSENAAKQASIDIDSFTDNSSYDSIRKALEDNKATLGEEEYNKQVKALNQKMADWIRDNVSIQGLSKTLTTTDDIDITINGKTFDLVAGKRLNGEGMDYSLNELATGDQKIYPDVGTVVAKDNKLYVYKESRKGKDWYEIGNDKDTVADAYAAYMRYGAPSKKYGGSLKNDAQKKLKKQ